MRDLCERCPCAAPHRGSWSHKPFSPTTTRSTSIASILTFKLILFDIPLPRATHLALRQRPRRRHHRRPRPGHASPLGPRDLLPVRRRGGVHKRRHSLPRCDAYRACRPSTAVDVHVDRRLPISGSSVDTSSFGTYSSSTVRGRAVRCMGRPGALFGAFGVSAVIHDLGMRGSSRGMEVRTAGGGVLPHSCRAALEYAFKG